MIPCAHTVAQGSILCRTLSDPLSDLFIYLTVLPFIPFIFLLFLLPFTFLFRDVVD